MKIWLAVKKESQEKLLSKISVRIVPKGIYNNYNKCFKVSTGKDKYNGKKISNWGYWRVFREKYNQIDMLEWEILYLIYKLCWMGLTEN